MSTLAACRLISASKCGVTLQLDDPQLAPEVAHTLAASMESIVAGIQSLCAMRRFQGSLACRRCHMLEPAVTLVVSGCYPTKSLFFMDGKAVHVTMPIMFPTAAPQ
eukprot:Opistho-2@19802